jgi:DNA-binding GntR family transcriptional regulator
MLRAGERSAPPRSGNGGAVLSEVYERLRADVVAGTFEAGAPLVELTLAERYGTSRTPVREALRRLEQDGLVERGDRGMRVRTRSPEEILEIYEARIALEATAASGAAQRHSEFDLIRIQRAQAAMRAAAESDADAVAAANRAVHEAIWAASRNGTVVDLLTRLNNHLTRYPATTLAVPGRFEQAVAEHDELIAAIEAREAERAHDIAREHMTRARNLRLQIYRDELAG